MAPHRNRPSLAETAGYFLRLIRLARPHWPGFARAAMVGVLVSFLGMIPPYLTKLYFDEVYPAKDVNLLTLLAVGVGALAAGSVLLSGIRAYYMQFVTSRLGLEFGLLYFNHVQHLPLEFFERHRVGEVASRLNDLRSSLGGVSRIFQTTFVSGAYLIVVPPLLFIINWRLALCAFVAAPFAALLTTATSRWSRRFLQESAESTASLTALQMEVLAQIRTVKGLALEPVTFAKARQQSETSLRAQMRSAIATSACTIANGMVQAVSAGVLTIVAWRTIIHGEMTVGDYVAFNSYLGFLVGPMAQTTASIADIQQTSIALARAFEYLDVVPEQDPMNALAEPAPVTNRLMGHVSLQNVTFSYGGPVPVLRNVSLTFEPGTVTAIMGPSGAGKSTIVRLIAGMSVPSAGQVFFDGMPLSQLAIRDVRRQLGTVWQEPVLFRGTLWENLVVDGVSLTRDRVQEVVRACRLEEVLDGLAQGYETIVGESGMTLSGGQRQRVAIARALLRDAPILLLDEPTSQLDARTEEEVIAGLLAAVNNRTIIFVTHRPAAAALADRVCLLDAGRIVALGSHAELARTCSAYQESLNVEAERNAPDRRVRVMNS